MAQTAEKGASKKRIKMNKKTEVIQKLKKNENEKRIEKRRLALLMLVKLSKLKRRLHAKNNLFISEKEKKTEVIQKLKKK